MATKANPPPLRTFVDLYTDPDREALGTRVVTSDEVCTHPSAKQQPIEPGTWWCRACGAYCDQGGVSFPDIAGIFGGAA